MRELKLTLFGQKRTILGPCLQVDAVRSGGPGGQNVNKVSSKIQLRFDLKHAAGFSDEERHRLQDKLQRKMDGDGVLHIQSQKTRDQKLNLEDALEKLERILETALKVLPPRKATKPSRNSVKRRLDSKKKQSDKKRNRQRIER